MSAKIYALSMRGCQVILWRLKRLTIVRIVFGECVPTELYIGNTLSIVGGDLFLFWVLL